MTDDLKWPHLENLDRVLKDNPDYLDSNLGLPGLATYTVTEKVHGFNARFGRRADGTPWAGSRNNTVAEGNTLDWDNDGLQGFLRFAGAKVMGLFPGETLFGEWAGKGVQKGIDYGERAFYAFGFYDEDGWAPFEKVEVVCDALDIPTVPVVARFYGAKPTITDLSVLRDAQSVLAKTPSKGEGIVISPFPPYLDQYGHTLIAKFKTADFEERAHARKEVRVAPTMEAAEDFASEYVTAMRLEHVLQTVKEDLIKDAAPTSDPLDVRATAWVMRSMVEDVLREGAADFATLPEAEQKAIGKVINPRTKALLLAARESAMLSLAN